MKEGEKMIINPIYNISGGKQESIDISVEITGHYKYDTKFYCEYFDFSTNQLITNFVTLPKNQKITTKFSVLVPGFVTLYPDIKDISYTLPDFTSFDQSSYSIPDYKSCPINTKYNVFLFHKSSGHAVTSYSFDVLLFILAE